MKARIVILVFALCCIIVPVSQQLWRSNMYTSDMLGYYMYLPTVFIYHDLDIMEKGMVPISEQAAPNDYARGEWNHNKYTLGVALSELPCFLIAYAIADNIEGMQPDGYSTPFQLAGIISTSFWVVLGLFTLRRLLRMYYDDTVTAVTLVCIAFASNLFYYSVYNHGMSHPFLFFLYSQILLNADLFYRHNKWENILQLAFYAGWAVITRPVSLLAVVVIVPWWGVYSINTLHQRILLFKASHRKVLAAVFVFIAVTSIQMFYWNYTTGHFVYYSYRNEGFNFLRPHILDGLFSYRKGWFVYTPVALGGVAGIYTLFRQKKAMAVVFMLYFMVTIYVVFSWKNWWYGGGFGARAMVESMAVLALPLASLASAIRCKRNKLLSSVAVLLMACCVALNLFQSYQFSAGIIHHDRMSGEYYWKVFGKGNINPADYEEYLMGEKEYWKGMEEITK